ncbi:MAG: hypothetical protein IT357_07195 [Gemmatimonadaceae bacterium]|nr:hypothetical protein [Gemmatimonadaceae bacterium]
MTTRRLVRLALAITATVGACSSRDATPGSIDGPWLAELDTLADTITVRTISGSAWGRA